MSTLLLKNIRTLVTCDDRDTVLENAGILCRDGVIAAMGPGLEQEADEVLDCTGMLSRSGEYPPPPVPVLLPEPAPGAEHGAVRLAPHPL